MILLLIFLFSDVSCLRNRDDSTPLEIRTLNGKIHPKVDQDALEAVRKAAKYIVNQVTDDGWGDFTPRAVVALSFADVVSGLNDDDKVLMIKYLKMHLMKDLLEMDFHRTKPSLVKLASYINALYASCLDPRSFHGHDLVSLLRSEVDAVLSPNFSYPYVLMSLCIADAIGMDDLNRLADMYNRNSKIGFKALVITAMSCNGQKNEVLNKQFKEMYVKNFFDESSEAADEMDIYSKALYLQAAIATNYSTPNLTRYQLKSLQQPDGSFGDMLATYSLIPVFLYSSLLDLRCKFPEKKALIESKEFKQVEKNKLVYSLWIITSEKVIDTRSIIVPFGENESFLDVMKTAAQRSQLYKFLYDETSAGKEVYSLAGIPNDIETDRKWTLYEGHPNVTIDSRKYLKEIKVGVDKIFPKNMSHYSFWLAR